MTFVLGLTGSVATGKSTVLQLFAEAGIPTISADKIVHDLYEGEAVGPVGALFPEAVESYRINRERLSVLLNIAPDRFAELEAVVHPLVRQKTLDFLATPAVAEADMAVIEIPLLFETGADYPLDATAVTWCADAELRRRALARPGMTVEKLDAILARQMPQAQKKQLARYVIDTGTSLEATRDQVNDIIADCRRRAAEDKDDTPAHMTREIVLDTETTGLSPASGDRVVEIGCVELVNHVPTGRTYHVYLNPEREMSADAQRVHGLDDAFLADKPKFHEEAGNFMEFVGDGTLIIHNAPFDMGFLNAELERSGRKPLSNEVIDTVQLAREKHPGARVSLDALCKHYGIDNSRRSLHGALLDSEILAEVYLELIGGRQVALALSAEVMSSGSGQNLAPQARAQRPIPLQPRLTLEEQQAHVAFIAKMGDQALWALYEKKAG